MDKQREPRIEVIWSRTSRPLRVATLDRIAPSGRRSPLRLAARGPVHLDPGARRARNVASHRRFGLQKGAVCPSVSSCHCVADRWLLWASVGRAVGCAWATRKGCPIRGPWPVPTVMRLSRVHSLDETVAVAPFVGSGLLGQSGRRQE